MKEITLNDGQKLQFPVEPTGAFVKIKKADGPGLNIRVPCNLGEIEDQCLACRGFGYTKGGPDGPWEKLDCKECEGKGRITRLHQLVIETEDPVMEVEAGPVELNANFKPWRHVQARVDMQAIHGLEGLVGDARAAQYLGEELIRALRKPAKSDGTAGEK